MKLYPLVVTLALNLTLRQCNPLSYDIFALFFKQTALELLDVTYKEIVSLFEGVKEKIIDFLILMIYVLIGPLYLYSLYMLGNLLSPASILNIVILSSMTFSILFRRKLSLSVKKSVLLFILVYGNLYSVYHYGFLGGTEFFMILTVGLVAFNFRKWIAITVSLALIVCYFIFMFLYTNGIIAYYKDPSELVNSRVVWLSGFLLTLLVISVTIYAIRITFIAYTQKVKEHIESRYKLNYTLQNMPIPVGVLNQNSKITQVNKSFIDYFGYEAVEIPTYNDWLRKVYPNPKLYEKKKNEGEVLMVKVFKERSTVGIEHHDLLTKDNIEKSVFVHYTVIGNTAICTFVDLTERKKQRRLIVETMMQAEKKENGRVARELHDGIGPLLSTAKIYIHSLSKEGDNIVRSEYLERLNYILDSSISEMRNIINNIDPQVLQKYGLSRAVQSFIKHIQLVSTTDIKFHSNQLTIKSKLIEFAIYRSLTELINNSLKYASAQTIKITMNQNEQEFILQYSDDGIGFDYEMSRFKGYGLENIRNRIENIGGEIRYTTSPGYGVVVDVVVPENSNRYDSDCNS